MYEDFEKIPFGEIITPKTYQKLVNVEHYMTKYEGFGISQHVLDKLKQHHIKSIMFIYAGKRQLQVYMAATKQYLESIQTHMYKDNDLQKFVSIDKMIQLK